MRLAGSVSSAPAPSNCGMTMTCQWRGPTASPPAVLKGVSGIQEGLLG
ncbi:hypothetical protein [Amycolatopsis plumensis]